MTSGVPGARDVAWGVGVAPDAREVGVGATMRLVGSQVVAVSVPVGVITEGTEIGV